MTPRDNPPGPTASQLRQRVLAQLELLEPHPPAPAERPNARLLHECGEYVYAAPLFPPFCPSCGEVVNV